MKNKKVIALIAHNNKKPDIVNQAIKNKEKLSAFELCGTEHTAKLISEATDLKVKAYMSGPMGGDQQIGAKIAEYAVTTHHALLFESARAV